MIAKLTGKVSDQFVNYLIIEVGGVGYKVEGSFPLFDASGQTTLFIHTHVRENEIRLFGFMDFQQLQLFEELLTVSGVGPKIALVLINNLGISTIVNAIQTAKPESLKSPGVGLKTAQRIVIDLKSKVDIFKVKADPQLEIKRAKEAELEQVLLDLGYNKFEISKAIADLDIDNTDM